MSIEAFMRRAWDIVETPTDEVWVARRGLAAALRALNHRVAAVDAPAPMLEQAAQRIAEAAEALAPFSVPSFRESFENGVYAESPEQFADRAWISGRSHPFGPAADLVANGEGAEATVCFDHGYVGAPGWVHGGAVAAVIDQLMGYVLVLQGSATVTAELNVRYVSPTPALVPLSVKAWSVGDEGRFVKLEASCRHGEVLTATASARFVRLDAEGFVRTVRKLREGT